MYLYIYARSERSRMIANKLLSSSEGELISDFELFGHDFIRADGAFLFILPLEASVKLYMERISTLDLRIPIIDIHPSGESAAVIRTGGYSTYEILGKVCSILGARPMSEEKDKEDYTPDLRSLISRYNMFVDNETLFDEMLTRMRNGGVIKLYSDIPIRFAEPILDTISITPIFFKFDKQKEITRAYEEALRREDEDSVFVSFRELPSNESNSRVVRLIPRCVCLGLEINPRTDSSYANEVLEKALSRYSIDKRAVSTLAISRLAQENEVALSLSQELEVPILSFDSKAIKASKIVINQGFYSDSSSDMCSSVSLLASGNGEILMRRAGEKNAITITASLGIKEISVI